MQKTPLLTLCVLAACGADPVSYSAPVGIELKVKSGEVSSANALTPDKSITSESGNPYGKFVSDAKARLGRDPGNIELDQIKIVLGAQSTNVAALEQVMTGDVYVKFLTNDTDNTFTVAHFASPAGQEATGHPSFSMASDVGAPDVPKILGGGFKVVLNAPAAADFATKGAEAVLQVTMTFTAFE
jgi:hypothetical protein